LRPGDRIVAVGGNEVRAVTDVSSAVSQAKSQKRPSVLLFVERGENQRVYVPVKIK
jgi:C-terminal processing protease CtpA/Prc